LTYFWLPLILGVVSYIFFQLRDVFLGIMTLVALSAIYTVIRLYFVYKKWWLFIILMVIVLASIGFFVTRAPAIDLTINGQKVTGSVITFTEGSVSVNPPPETNSKYSKNTEVTLSAHPAAGYDWKSWTGTANDFSNPTTVIMSRNKEVNVTFESRSSLIINNQLVIGSIVSFTEGSVSVSPAPESDGKYISGTEVTLTAHSNSGYDWISWSGTGYDSSNPTTISTGGGNKQITVFFEPRFSLIINNQLVIGPVISFPEGSVSVDPVPGTDDKYAYGTKITISAAPDTGYGWKNWSGTGSDTSNPATVVMNSDKHMAVTFEQRFLLTINDQVVTGATAKSSGGNISLNAAPGEDGRYTKDAIITITAAPDPGYRFGHWSGDTSGTITSITITMNSNKNLSAVFIRTYNLAASAEPFEGGTVSPAGGIYDENTNVNLTASPASGYRFDHWSGDASGTNSSTVVTMNGDKNITAIFIRVYSLNTSIDPAGSGAVSTSGGSYDEGTSVLLTATPASGYRFDHWGGDASGNVTPVTITMNGNKNVTAVFVKVFTLTISVDPSEGGIVSPAAGTYDEGTTVTLNATPLSGYTFDHWGGDASGTDPSITITMNGNKNITAIFSKNTP